MKFKWYWWLFLISCPQLLIAGNRFIVPAGTSISDIMVTHFPNLLFIQQSLFEGHGIPLWSPLIFSGYPFGANPLSTLWYPPAWLALCFPLPLGINLVMALHIIAGCAGMVFLLRNMRLNEPLVLLGGVLIGLLPAGFARITGGHFTWVCASAWFPWLLALSYFQYKSGTRKVILTAGAIGLMLLADLRFAVYGVAIWIFLNLFLLISDRQSNISTKLKDMGLIGLSMLLAMGISAVVWLPLLEYSELSTRNLLTIKDTFYLSLPALQMLGILVPGHPQTFEWVIYLGAGLIIPGLFSLTLLHKKKCLLFWWPVAVICLIWSLGDLIPLNQLLAGLPGLNMVRVPARAAYFLSVSLLIISMVSLNDFLDEEKGYLKFFRLGVLGILVFTAMVQIGTYVVNPISNSLLLFHAFFTITISISFLVFTYNRIRGQVFNALLSFLIICDFSMANWELVGYRSLQEALAEGAEESEYLISKGADFREFSPSYSIPQQTSAYSNLELVEGIDPLQLASYVDYVNRSAALSTSQYSVTLPAFTTGNLKEDNAGIKPDAAAFGLLNTRYMVSTFPVESNGWVLEKKTVKNFIYFNGFTRGWAWVENNGQDSEEGYSPVTNISRTYNEIVVEAEGPGTLVLSENNYPGWEATVDGVPQKIETAHSILRSVDLPSGRHNIRFRFLPLLLFTGVGISMLSLLIFLIMLKKSYNND